MSTIIDLGWKATLATIDEGMKVAMRIDLNAPWSGRLEDLASSWRLQAVIPGIRAILRQHASVLLISHFGRPEVGVFESRYSLAPFAQILARLLELERVPVIKHWTEGVDYLNKGVVMAENVRFEEGERSNAPEFGKKIAALCDYYIVDAFGVAHRRHASVCSAVDQAQKVSAGPLMESELRSLNNVIHQAERPLTVILGGSKVSTKLKLIERMLTLADHVIPGGGIANILMKAQGYSIGKSQCKEDDLKIGEHLLAVAEEQNCKIAMPVDVVVADRLSSDAPPSVRRIGEVNDDEIILDVSERTLAYYKDLIARSKAVLWNGPLGVFEWESFSYGTFELARTLALSNALVVAGGGETLKVIDTLGLRLNFDYISTGGGAMMALLEGAPMPAMESLERRLRS